MLRIATGNTWTYFFGTEWDEDVFEMWEHMTYGGFNSQTACAYDVWVMTVAEPIWCSEYWRRAATR